MAEFETNVHIRCRVEDVFDYVADPLKFPQWNSAVQTVRATSEETGAVGSTYVMERQLPGGRVENSLEILTLDRPHEFVVHTTSGPTPLVYRYRFVAAGNETDMTLEAHVELSGIAGLASPLVKQGLKRGVDDNLASLKRLLEAQATSQAA